MPLLNTGPCCTATGSGRVTEQPGPLAGRAEADSEIPERFSLVAGGGYHALLGRCGWLNDDGLPTTRTALVLALLAWSLPAAFVALQSLLTDYQGGEEYFLDPTVYCRYLLAVFILVTTERMADERVSMLIRQFRDSGLLDQRGGGQFALAVREADRRVNSGLAEIVILVFAFVWSVSTTQLSTVLSVDGWEGAVGASGEVALSWAGEVSAFVSNTLFLFLVLRWFWRFFIWASLLRKTAGLDLKLMPLHPDRCGGLGFLGIFPGIFSGLILALSSVIAAAFYKAAKNLEGAGDMLWLAVSVWTLLVAAIFLGPLLFFSGKLYLTRERALLDYGRLAHGHHMRFHARWVETPGTGEDLLGSAEPSSVSDLNASVQAAHDMRVFPVDRQALLQMLACAVLPLAISAAVQMPVAELLQLIIGVVF